MLQVGDVFIARVITNTEAGARITAADVQLQFDAKLLRASACMAGSGVQDIAGFECRLNMPRLLNSVQLSYVTASGTTTDPEVGDLPQQESAGDMDSNTAVELGLVTFQVATPLLFQPLFCMTASCVFQTTALSQIVQETREVCYL